MNKPNLTPSELKKILLPRLVRKFIETESAAGVFMICCLVLATILSNSHLHGWYESFINATISVGYNGYSFVEPLKEWVKDVLMVFFFFIVAMELKTEVLEGFLSKPGQVRLPMLAALGGVAVPALIYYGLNHHNPEHIAGWAIPSATDIAFALAILVLAGRNVPPSAKIFLLAIAIFDDLFAILIIAFFYSSGVDYTPLIYAGAGLAILLFLNFVGITDMTPYLIIGIFLWICLHHAGIHTTLAGVAVGLAIPMRDPENPNQSPLKHLMHLFHGWVSFLVLPLFAFTAAGINFEGMTPSMLLDPVPMGIALGLFFGKQIGIFLTTLILVTLRLARLPEGMNWRHVYGVSLVAGIGFTMSLFIGLLAFDDPHTQQMVKAGVIGGSTLASLFGFIVLRFCCNASLPKVEEPA
jgi:Na+:H+ antiporter, NhaA family